MTGLKISALTAVTQCPRPVLLVLLVRYRPLAHYAFGSFFCLAVPACRRKQLAKTTEVSNIALSTGQSCTYSMASRQDAAARLCAAAATAALTVSLLRRVR